jgi:hypothetical protein
MNLPCGLQYPGNLKPQLRPFRRFELPHALQICGQFPQCGRQIIPDAAEALNRILTEKDANLIPISEYFDLHAFSLAETLLPFQLPLRPVLTPARRPGLGLPECRLVDVAGCSNRHRRIIFQLRERPVVSRACPLVGIVREDRAELAAGVDLHRLAVNGHETFGHTAILANRTALYLLTM